MQHTITIPNEVNFYSAIRFVNQLHEMPDADEYLVDFKNFRWIEPFGLLLVSSELRKKAIVLGSIGREMYAINFQGKNSYASHMGFYRACGLNLVMRRVKQ